MNRGLPALYRLIPYLVCLTLTACGGGPSSDSSSVTGPPPDLLAITTVTPLQAVVGVPYSFTLQTTGGTGALTWSLATGQLPSGLMLDSSSGVISGTPAGGGAGAAFTIGVKDSQKTVTKVFSFNIFTKLGITPVTPPAAHLSTPYSLQLTVQSSGSAVASWGVASGQLPPGLQLAVNNLSSNLALISGTPAQAGSFSFSVQIQDYTIPQTAVENFTIVVDNRLAISKWTLRQGGQNQIYADSFSVVNGAPPYRWSVTGLPSTLTTDAPTGAVSGVPTDYGTYSYTVTVTDSSSPQQTDTQQASVVLLQQLQILSQTTLPTAILNEPYNDSVVAVGGQPPYTWSISSGQLPTGTMQFGASGGFSGIATQLGNYNFVVSVRDSSSPGYTVSETFTLSVKPIPLQIAGPYPPSIPLGLLYHSQISLFGGVPPFSWSILSGQLPTGLNFDSSTGYIDGVPTQLGFFTVRIGATDSAPPPQNTYRDYTIEVRNSLGRNDSIATATVLGNGSWQASISPYMAPVGSSTANPDSDYYRIWGAAGTVINAEAQSSFLGSDPLDPVMEILNANGQRLQSCVAPSYHSDCLNDDINSSTLDSALAVLVPGTPGTQSPLYVHVFDFRGDARPDMQYLITISGAIQPLTISPSSLGAGATRGANYQQQFTSTGGTGTVAWSVAVPGTLPTGWLLTSTGLLNGVATGDAAYSFTIRATDSGSPPQVAQTSYTLVIAEPLVITTPAQLPNACVGQPYTFTMQSTGGLPPLFWGWQSSGWPINFPPSPVTTPDLVFTGVPQTVGSYQAIVGITDSAQPSSGMNQHLTINVVNCP